MVRTVNALLLTAALLLLGCLLVPGCGDDYGESCSLPTKVRAACRQASSPGVGLESHINCVMQENLDCSSKTCVVYEDSAPFCSLACKSDSDCPGGASCLSFFILEDAGSYCVPKSKIPAGG